jgi:hypothetical protein
VSRKAFAGIDSASSKRSRVPLADRAIPYQRGNNPMSPRPFGAYYLGKPAMTPADYRRLLHDIDEAVDLIRRRDNRLSPLHTGLFECLLTLREDLEARQADPDDENVPEDNLRAARLVLSRDALAAAIDVLRETEDQPDAPALVLAMASVANRLEKVLTTEATSRRHRMALRRRRRTPRPIAA